MWTCVRTSNLSFCFSKVNGNIPLPTFSPSHWAAQGRDGGSLSQLITLGLKTVDVDALALKPQRRKSRAVLSSLVYVNLTILALM